MEVKISRNAIRGLETALRSLDELKPKFPVKVAFALYKNLVACQKYNEDVETIRRKKVEERLPKGASSLEGTDAQEFLSEWGSFLAEEDKIELLKVKFEELNVETNGIPVSTLAAFDPFMEVSVDLESDCRKSEREGKTEKA